MTNTKTPLSELQVLDAGKFSDADRYWVTNKKARRVVRVKISRNGIEISTINWRYLPEDFGENGVGHMGPAHNDILSIVQRMI